MLNALTDAECQGRFVAVAVHRTGTSCWCALVASDDQPNLRSRALLAVAGGTHCGRPEPRTYPTRESPAGPSSLSSSGLYRATLTQWRRSHTCTHRPSGDATLRRALLTWSRFPVIALIQWIVGPLWPLPARRSEFRPDRIWPTRLSSRPPGGRLLVVEVARPPAGHPCPRVSHGKASRARG